LEKRTGTTENTYRYTGEYFDDAIGLQYNRARWYEANSGRFVSQDTWIGKSKYPITQNKYIYANVDPVNRIDPSGHMSIAGSMAGIGGMAILGSIAIAMISWKPMPGQSGFDPAYSHRKFSIFDAIVVPRLRESSEEKSITIAEEIEKEKRRRDPDHHTIPVYLCGGVSQEMYARIPYAAHVAIHGEIAAIGLSLKAGENYAYKLLGYKRMDEMLKLAQTNEGRAAISNALRLVYQQGWWDVGTPSIGMAFTASVGSYLSGANTSLPWCSRSGKP
jgi:RHS repeat-associated protein